MKTRILSLFLVLSLLFALTPSAAAAGSASAASRWLNSGKSSLSELVNTVSSTISKLYFKLLFGSDSFYKNQWQTIRSTTKLNDNVYMLNYQYDYDIDDLLARGTGSVTDFLAYASGHLLFGKFDLKLNLDDLGCSAFTCFNGEGDHLMGRNFDYKDAPCFVVWTDPDDGYASVSMVDANMMLFGDLNKPCSPLTGMQVLLAPYLALDGINEKGLSIGVLQMKADGTDQDNGKTDIITTVAIRAVLDKCADVNEAIALISDFDMHDMMSGCSYHYQLSDAKGNSCVIEYIDNEMRVLWAEPEAGTQAVTNFFLSPDGVADEPQGEVRFETIQTRLAAAEGILSETEAMKLLNTVHLNYRHHIYPWYVTTLWSSVYSANDLTMDLCVRMKYDTIYQFSPLNPGKASVLPGNAVITDYVQAPD